jgi:hypothetical protein
MDLGSLLLGLALLLLVGAYVARPLFEAAPAEPVPAEAHADLIAEREAVLSALADLEFDHRTGKISAEDYQAQRAALVSQGAAILRRLDESGAGRPDLDLDAEIEAAIAARRRAPAPPPAPRAEAGPAPKFCPNCGSPVLAGDRFCARCGTRLAAPEQARQAHS